MKLEHFAVTAFLSEGCDPCVKVEKHIRDFGRNNPEIPVYITYSEEALDICGIEMTPTVGVTDFEDEVNYILEGYKDFEYFKEFMEESMPQLTLSFPSDAIM